MRVDAPSPRGQRQLSRGWGLEQGTLPCPVRLCGQDTDKGKDVARGPAEAGEFWEGWGSRGGDAAGERHLASRAQRSMARTLRCPPGEGLPASGGHRQRGFAQQHLPRGLHAAGISICKSKGAMGWEVAGLEGDRGGTALPVPSTCHGRSSATSSPGPWYPTPPFLLLAGVQEPGVPGNPCCHPAMPTFLLIQGGRCGGRGAGARIRCGVLQAQGVKPLGRGGGQASGQHREDAEYMEEVLGAAGPHAAASGPGCPGRWGLAHPARLHRLLPLPRHGSHCYHGGPRAARHAPRPPQHPCPKDRIQGGLSTHAAMSPSALWPGARRAAGNCREGSQGQEELLEVRQGRTREEMLLGNGE